MKCKVESKLAVEDWAADWLSQERSQIQIQIQMQNAKDWVVTECAKIVTY